MSRLKRISSRIAALSGEVIKKLSQKYGVHPGTVRRIENNTHYDNLYPEDLWTEWGTKAVSQGAHYPEDFFRMKDAWTFYRKHFKDPRYKEVAKRIFPGKNPKNILDYSLHELEEVNDEFEQPPVDPRVHQLSNKLPEGAELIYKDPNYQVVEVTDPWAACKLGKGTKWCTSMKERNRVQRYDESTGTYHVEEKEFPFTAQSYLEEGPLYIIYHKGKKIAQFHENSGQMMDLKDVDLDLKKYPGLFGVLRKLKLFDSTSLHDRFEWAQKAREPWEEIEKEALKRGKAQDFARLYSQHARGSRWEEAEEHLLNSPYNLMEAVLYARDVIKGRWKELEQRILSLPDSQQKASLATEYAEYAIKGPWKEAEPLIAKYPSMAFYYALHVLHGRFPQAEPLLKRNPTEWQNYLLVMNSSLGEK